MSKKNIAERLFQKYLKKIKAKVGKGTTYSDDLTNMGIHLFGKLYKGTFSADKIPILKKGEFIIINNEPSSKSGEHWLLAIKTQDDKVYLYDSFGRKHFKEHCRNLKSIGLSSTIHFNIYYFGLLLFGDKFCKSIILLIKKVIGRRVKL